MVAVVPLGKREERREGLGAGLCVRMVTDAGQVQRDGATVRACARQTREGIRT